MRAYPGQTKVRFDKRMLVLVPVTEDGDPLGQPLAQQSARRLRALLAWLRTPRSRFGAAASPSAAGSRAENLWS